MGDHLINDGLVVFRAGNKIQVSRVYNQGIEPRGMLHKVKIPTLDFFEVFLGYTFLIRPAPARDLVEQPVRILIQVDV